MSFPLDSGMHGDKVGKKQKVCRCSAFSFNNNDPNTLEFIEKMSLKYMQRLDINAE